MINRNVEYLHNRVLELSELLDKHVSQRRLLIDVLEQEYGRHCGDSAGESPEEIIIQILHDQDAMITSLRTSGERIVRVC